MKIPFTKMHALGNDYILINGFEYGNLINEAHDLAVKMSDRHFSIGGDGVIFVMPSENADCMMRIFNADGSEAEMCGNGIRQVAKFAMINGIVKNKSDISVETLAGIKNIEISDKDNRFFARVNMGKPILNSKDIPANVSGNKRDFATVELDVIDKHFEFTLVSMGNPHAITFVDKVDNFPVGKYGKVVENLTSVFPKRTNVEFIEVVNEEEINMRVWERGSGETLACGSGACASVVACVLNGLTKRKVKVNLLGGPLYIEWQDNGNVIMTGDACVSFTGVYEIDNC